MEKPNWAPASSCSNSLADKAQTATNGPGGHTPTHLQGQVASGDWYLKPSNEFNSVQLKPESVGGLALQPTKCLWSRRPQAAPREQDYARGWLFSDDILKGTVTGSQE